jgi:hypothetical protein
VRGLALSTLMVIGKSVAADEARAATPIIKAMASNDPDPQVRKQAAQVLRGWGESP